MASKTRKKRTAGMNFFIFIILITFLSFLLNSSASALTLSCSISESAGCNNVSLLYLQNDTGGYYNSHAQNLSVGTYSHSLCCSVDSGTLSASCGTTFLKLFNNTNSHVQVANYSGDVNYDVSACLSISSATVSCTYASGGCASGYVCLASIASSESIDRNLTNSHIGPCEEYNNKICCLATATSSGSSGSSASSSSSSSGGGGGGGGAGAVSFQSSFIEAPDGLSFSSVLEKADRKEFKIKNNLDKILVLEVETQGLDDYISIEKSISLEPFEEKTINLIVAPLETGLLTGKIVFLYGSQRMEIPVVLNVMSEDFLFDAKIAVSQQQRRIIVGENLKTQVSLLQVGPHEKVDVTATYVIKDFSGNILLEDTETFFVLESKDFIKEFHTDNLPPGKYIVGLEIFYPGAFATSSVQFEVLEKGYIPFLSKLGLSKQVQIAVMAFLIFSLLGISAVFWIYHRKRTPRHLR